MNNKRNTGETDLVLQKKYVYIMTLLKQLMTVNSSFFVIVQCCEIQWHDYIKYYEGLPGNETDVRPSQGSEFRY